MQHLWLTGMARVVSNVKIVTLQCLPKKNITEGTCIACHGSYKKIAEKTEELDVNPHDSHQGEVPCTRCHSGHKKSVLFCNGCHEFPMTVP